ncbi:hypothetical protein BGT96224_5519 [Blumeria graminis f. sp. tritici 96224]|uniref:Small ribosomal subunit protein mS38 n=1 Tax=Blumeria graminis f. sp. tritici 96224 TaxID=1268274 RepID=A0A381LJ92_BLUGR|nr:hypothetical protein BGT96224_5519 [Blumeria graminis f. sp. tritici 96224]
MLLSSVRRLVLVVPPAPVSSTLVTNTSRSVTSNVVTSRCHQRRASSSKPSSPSNGSKGVIESRSVSSTAAESSSSQKELSHKDLDTKTTTSGNTKSKIKRSLSKTALKNKNQPFLNLPSVPSTQHITPSCETHKITLLGTAAFFSLHRPISITNGFPHPVSDEAFASIFRPRIKSTKSQEILMTLTNTLDNFDAVSEALDILHLDSEQKNLGEADGDLSGDFNGSALTTSNQRVQGNQNHDQSLNFLSGKYAPFNPPPAPLPIDSTEPYASIVGTTESRSNQNRIFTAILTVEESMDPNGNVTFIAHHSPLIAEDAPNSNRFSSRMQIRQQRHRSKVGKMRGMLAISVKRQRKLKMKKHKYKKLMRRTRNLRRKLDRN